MLLNHCPDSAKVPTRRGRLPLHLVLNKSGRECNKRIVSLLLNCYPAAASVPTKNGHYPLHIAIWSRCSAEVIFDILSAFPRAAQIASPKTGLYPVDLALERALPEEIINTLLRETAKKSQGDRCNSDNGRDITSSAHYHPHASLPYESIFPRDLTVSSPHCGKTDARLNFCKPQSANCRTNQVSQTARAAAMRIQPWARGCLERSKNLLSIRRSAVVLMQAWVRRSLARTLSDRRRWASEEIGLWLIGETVDWPHRGK